MKIMLVDDEEKFINMLAKRLHLRGFEAHVAFSGDDALKLAGEICFDVAVLDIKMPGISGVQLKAELAISNPDLKCIFVTGHGRVDKPQKENSGDEIYLSKPLNIDVLIKTIRDITGDRS